MDKECRIAFINAQVACALAAIAAMQAANHERVTEGAPLKYSESAFMAVQNEYMISHNAVIDYLRD